MRVLPSHPSLDTVYAVTAFGTLLVGFIGLSAGFRTEVLEPLVLSGAIVVGAIGIYWLLGRENAYGET
jgi:hypothetical protein